jgi:hypothetical protein
MRVRISTIFLHVSQQTSSKTIELQTVMHEADRRMWVAYLNYTLAASAKFRVRTRHLNELSHVNELLQ